MALASSGSPPQCFAFTSIATCCVCVSIPLALADCDLTHEDLVSLLDGLPSLRTLVLEYSPELMTMVDDVSWSCLCSEHMYKWTHFVLLILYALRTLMH